MRVGKNETSKGFRESSSGNLNKHSKLDFNYKWRTKPGPEWSGDGRMMWERKGTSGGSENLQVGKNGTLRQTFWLKSEIYYLCLIYLFTQFMFILRINLQKVRAATPQGSCYFIYYLNSSLYFDCGCLKLFNDPPPSDQHRWYKPPREYSIRVISESCTPALWRSKISDHHPVLR